ncbi:MAG: hypothetical protein LBC37_00290 [Zoogloeaceae bacterium]|nr:hypothetical protein [Zoogloeaceae bacterium]
MHTQSMNTRTVPVLSQPLHDKRREDVANVLGDTVPDVVFDALDAGDGEGLLDGIGGSLADAAGAVVDAAGAVFEHLVDGL